VTHAAQPAEPDALAAFELKAPRFDARGLHPQQKTVKSCIAQLIWLRFGERLLSDLVVHHVALRDWDFIRVLAEP